MTIMDQSWVKVQEKAFTRWCNAHLGKRGLEMKDMQTDFKSGVNLINLLEIIGECTFEKWNKTPRLEIQMRENIDKCLKFIESRGVKLTAIGSGDIYNGNLKLILGLIWTVILRFQISEISVEELTAKEALLLWCQRKTAGYKGVNVKDFTFSWQDGLGFCALIHKHRPDLIDFDNLDPKDKMGNLNHAFEVAKTQLGIPKFLDAEDMADVKPDEKSVMTYLAEYFKYFSKGQKSETAGRRINKVCRLVMGLNEQKNAYNEKATNFVNQVQEQMNQLNDRNFANSIQGVKDQLEEFKQYKKNVKPNLTHSKLELTTDLGKLNTKLNVNNRNKYQPPQGLSLDEIDQLWTQLGEAEQNRSQALRDELQRLNRQLLDEYEKAAADFNQFIDTTKDKIQNVSGDLNQQIL
jgi:archaellum component FlaC